METFNYGIVISFSMAFIINRINRWIQLRPHLYPKNIQKSTNIYLNWKWRNFFVSFIHSMVTGIGSLLCVCYKPKLVLDVVDTYLESAYILTSASHGYFIYDIIEMITNIRYKGSKELVLHHLMILTCFSITVIEHKYVGYSCIALLIELSNIFLHFRQLLLIADYSKASTIYRINSIINVVMFVAVRGLCLMWLWYTLYLSLPKVPIIPQCIAFISLTGICGITLVLFYRLLIADFVYSNSSRKTVSKTCGTNDEQMIADRNIGHQSASLLSNANSNGHVFKDYQQNNTLRLRENS